MLNELHIENIAVIEKADIEFTPGFNVLTGETGAGKSIIIDAIDSVLGGRASRGLVRSGADKASVSAVFTASAPAEKWCVKNDVDCDDELILTRRISAQGKGTCKVNGTPVSASQMRELGALLLDIHGQNDGRQLLDETRHRAYLDRFGETGEAFMKYRRAYKQYRDIVAEGSRLSMDEAEKENLCESLKAQIEELESADVRPGEEDELNSRRDTLRNAGKLSEAADDAYDAVYGGDGSVIEQLASINASLETIGEIRPEMTDMARIVTDARYNLEDVAERLRDFRRELDFSPEEYDEIELRLGLIRRLCRKYRCTEDQLSAKAEAARARLDEIEYAGDRIIALRKELKLKKKAVLELGSELTAKRRAAAERLQQRITDELCQLSMPSVRFTVEISPITAQPGFDASGCDEISFLMSANAGELPGRISKIASGGELSRIMLAMKNVFAEKEPVETLIFDEIDTGVSGIAAQRVGEKLGQLSRTKQVLCVTHLPQIAAMADTHFAIVKTEHDGRTYTDITHLDRQGRKNELARLHGGDNITENTLISAEEQLASAERYKAGDGGC